MSCSKELVTILGRRFISHTLCCLLPSLFSHVLLEAGADPNTHTMSELSTNPLEGAALYMISSSICSSASPTTAAIDVAEEIVKDLLSHGAKVGSSTMALLPSCAHRGRVHGVKFLLDLVKVDPNYRGRQGMTCLIFASRSGKIEIVKLLLEYDSLDLNIVDDVGKKAIDYATANGKDEIVALLLERS